ncbi:MAG: hypothetical protein MK082_02450 [Phycisphaerales bacterium]|nr:hypothetical protein [Phycisphaerales bacterium]
MNMKHIVVVSSLLLCLAGCSSSQSKEPMHTITRHNGCEMEQLSNIGAIWISEQPTESDFIWMRDNGVSLVLDVRSRDVDPSMLERAYVVTLGMKYQAIPMEDDQDYVIKYFDYVRDILNTRKHAPTLIHGVTADRAAGVWMVHRVLDDKVGYSIALAEAELAGLDQASTLLLVQQYLMSFGVDVDLEAGLSAAAPMTSEQGADEVIHVPDPSPEETASAPQDEDSRRD